MASNAGKLVVHFLKLFAINRFSGL
jgi:hypothetical protein